MARAILLSLLQRNKNIPIFSRNKKFRIIYILCYCENVLEDRFYWRKYYLFMYFLQNRALVDLSNTSYILNKTKLLEKNNASKAFIINDI